MKYFFKIFFSFLIAFSLILGGVLYCYLNYEDEQKQGDVKITELDDKIKKERVNILLMGIDSLDGTYKNEDAKPSRTDTMMILSMDPNTKSAFILSLPRDSRVKIRGMENYDKLNHAHAYGGVDLALKTVKDLTQIPIHHYVRVDYNALFKTVDDLGGVEVDVPIDMNYDDPWATPPLSIHLKKGIQTLNGEKAMEFLRFRKGYVDQDLGRINAQQQFLESLIRKVLSPASITKIPQYIETMYMYVDTDMSQKEILSLAKDGIRINPDNIEKETIPGNPEMINGVSFYVIDKESMGAQLEYLLSGSYEETASGSENTESDATSNSEAITPEVAPQNLKITVYNGSGYKNIARRASDILKIEDILVTDTGNASSFDNQDTHIYYKSDKELAKKVKKALGVGRIFKGTLAVDYNEPDIVVILGKDFKNEN
ncbi:MAG: LCP family protein [Filifactoraceae bacterium]